jgi:hypothetical protein
MLDALFGLDGIERSTLARVASAVRDRQRPVPEGERLGFHQKENRATDQHGSADPWLVLSLLSLAGKLRFGRN